MQSQKQCGEFDRIKKYAAYCSKEELRKMLIQLVAAAEEMYAQIQLYSKKQKPTIETFENGGGI